MKPVKVYSTPGCPFCKMVKEFLKGKNVEFQEINVAQDPKAAEFIVAKTGQLGVPVTKIGEEFVVGADKARIEKLLI